MEIKSITGLMTQLNACGKKGNLMTFTLGSQLWPAKVTKYDLAPISMLWSRLLTPIFFSKTLKPLNQDTIQTVGERNSHSNSRWGQWQRLATRQLYPPPRWAVRRESPRRCSAGKADRLPWMCPSVETGRKRTNSQNQTYSTLLPLPCSSSFAYVI